MFNKISEKYKNFNKNLSLRISKFLSLFSSVIPKTMYNTCLEIKVEDSLIKSIKTSGKEVNLTYPIGKIANTSIKEETDFYVIFEDRYTKKSNKINKVLKNQGSKVTFYSEKDSIDLYLEKTSVKRLSQLNRDFNPSKASNKKSYPDKWLWFYKFKKELD